MIAANTGDHIDMLAKIMINMTTINKPNLPVFISSAND
jgi:hypothetical protein